MSENQASTTVRPSGDPESEKVSSVSTRTEVGIEGETPDIGPNIHPLSTYAMLTGTSICSFGKKTVSSPVTPGEFSLCNDTVRDLVWLPGSSTLRAETQEGGVRNERSG